MKLAETPPSRCSSCFAQYPDRVHVDFEVAWEGPTFAEGIAGEGGEVTNTIKSSIDDMVVCDECMRAAAALLGLKDPDEIAVYAEKLEAQVDELLEKVRGYELHAANLESAIASKPSLASAA